jgi:serine protease
MPIRHKLEFFVCLLILLVSCQREPLPPEGPVALLLDPPDILSLEDPSSTLSISNPGLESRKWSIQILQNDENPIPDDWFTLSSIGGTLKAGQQSTLTITLKDDLKPGLYIATLGFKYQKKTKIYRVMGLIETAKFTLEEISPSSVLGTSTPITLPITISPENGFSGEVDLSLAGLPSGISGSFSPNPATSTSTLTLTTDGTTTPGNYSLGLVGKSQNISATTLTTVLVATDNTQPSFNFSIEESSLELPTNQPTTTTISILRSGGFATPVTLSAENIPDGISVSFNPNPATTQSTLSLLSSPELAHGSYTFTLKGIAAATTQTTLIHISATNDKSASLEGNLVTDNFRVFTPAPQTAVQTAPGKAHFVSNQLLVKYKETPVGDLSTQAQYREQMSLAVQRDYGLRVLERGESGQYDLVESTQDVRSLARQLERDPRIEYAEPNYLLEPLELPNDPRLVEQWALSVTGLPVAWSVETGNTFPVTVAVIDTGYDLSHPDLKAQFLPGFDFCKESQVVQVKNDAGTLETKLICNGTVDKNPTFGNPNNFHGTHVAGLIAAIGNNAMGIAGAAFGNQVKLLPVKIFDNNGSAATVDTFVKGIRWAVGLEVEGVATNPNPARIINLSLGGLFQSDAIDDAVNEAYLQGALILGATGNDSQDTLRTPAASNHVVGVGSVEIDYSRSSFSNYSAQKKFGPGVVDLMAPGGNSNGGLLSTIPSSYGLSFGTSMATPIASGIAALLLSQSPGLSVDTLEKKLLASTYVDPGFMNPTEYGKGVLRADLALGLPGPNDTVTIILKGPSIHHKAIKLTPDGKSESFVFSNLEPGNYRLYALSNGSSAQLFKTLTYTLKNEEDKMLEINIP